MKIFLDTGDVEAVARASRTGLLDGVTTNPTLIAGNGGSLYEIVSAVCSLTSGPVSVEVMSEEKKEMIAEAEFLASIAANVVIKIPMTVEGLKSVPVLKKMGIRTNVTMIFSPTQAFLAMKSGASFLSLVLGRLDAVGNESEMLIKDAMEIKQRYGFPTEVIAGSVKTQNHVLNCLRSGVNVVTIPEALFFQLFCHPLTDIGLETFRRDWEKNRRHILAITRKGDFS
jgi:transaldolase